MNHSPAHTPKLGATIHYLPSFRNGTVSIHASAGERQSYSNNLCRPRCFNPRSHVGSDLLDRSDSHRQAVSIHAPTWGATKLGSNHIRSIDSFNPRSHVGSDIPAFTHLFHVLSFNPRSHVGSDPISGRGGYDSSVSIHAPTWGATQRATA